jgi:hypothetical protein
MMIPERFRPLSNAVLLRSADETTSGKAATTIDRLKQGHAHNFDAASSRWRIRQCQTAMPENARVARFRSRPAANCAMSFVGVARNAGGIWTLSRRDKYPGLCARCGRRGTKDLVSII